MASWPLHGVTLCFGARVRLRSSELVFVRPSILLLLSAISMVRHNLLQLVVP